MPLAGYICCRDGEPRDFDDCIHANRKGLCRHSLPLLSAMKMNSERRSGIGISSSVLNMCPRQYILGERNDYYEAPEDFYNRWRGSFGHYAIEMGGPYPGVVQEVRFYRTIDVDGTPFTISGQPDWVDVETRHISDAKFVARSPKQPYQDHENQVNVYAWLLEGGYIRHTDYRVIDFTRDGAFLEEEEVEVSLFPGDSGNPMPAGWQAQTADVNYMDAKGEHRFPLAIWTDEARERFIRERLRPHKEYRRTGNLASVGVRGTEESWKSKFCPFMRDENPGKCCMENREDAA